MSKFTPGPWRASQPHGTIYIDALLSGTTWQEICAVGPTATSSQREYNAQLIIAAPELLHLVMSWRALQSQWHPDRYESEKADLIKETDDLVAKISKAQSITDDDGIPL